MCANTVVLIDWFFRFPVMTSTMLIRIESDDKLFVLPEEIAGAL
jgi:hypothetical protein